jgi:hypothetical protein
MHKVASLPWFIHKHDTGAKHATSIQVSEREKRKTHYACVQRLSRAIQSRVENHHFLITSQTKDQVPSRSCSPTASPYIHTRRRKRPSLGSQRVSKHILGNPILGHTDKWCTQLIMWVSMMQMPVRVKRISITLGIMPQRSNSWRKPSAIISKKANILRVRRRRTNTNTMETCRGPTKERLETCPRAWPNSLERVS